MTELSLFDYSLPDELVAVVPTERRDQSRLLCLDRRTGAVEHRSFSDVPELLRPGDVLVLNDARVVPARLEGRRATGGRVEVLLVRPCGAEAGAEGEAWLAMLHARSRLRAGEVVSIELAGAALGLLEPRGGGCWLVALRPPGKRMQDVLQHGQMPLPPYVLRARRKRGLPQEQPELDRERYQTVYAHQPGAVAAPTAGLHFTWELLKQIGGRGVLVRPLTLLVGPGTFRPVRTDRVEDHVLEPERYWLPGDTARAVEEALREGRRVVATGTTCCRVLEHVARSGRWEQQEGWADLFIYPPFEFRVVGALITNFHLPRSTLLMLVCAFAGRERVLEAYRIAIERTYRFYSYGDAMFIH